MDKNPNQAQAPYDESAYQQPPPGPSTDQQDWSQGGYQPYQPFYQGQPPYGPPPLGNISPFEMTSMGMRARTAGLLCYLFSWVTGLIFLLLERENRFVRFHAMQSLLFFGAMSILSSIVRFFEVMFSYGFPPYFGFGFISSALGIITFVCWIILMVSAHRGRYYKLPIVGDLAEKYAFQFRI